MTRPHSSLRLVGCGEGSCCRNIVTGYTFAGATQDSTGLGGARCTVGGYSEAAGRARAIAAATDLDELDDLRAAAARARALGSISDDECLALGDLAARRADDLAGRRAA